MTELETAARTLRPIKLPLSALGLMAALVLLLVVLIITTSLQLGSMPIFGSILIVGLSFLLLAGLMALRPGATYVSLDRDGMTYSVSYRKKQIRWTEIRNVHVGWIGYETFNIFWNKFVFIDYHQGDRKLSLGIYPRLFELNAEQLQSLISRFHEQAVSASSADGRFAAESAISQPDEAVRQNDDLTSQVGTPGGAIEAKQMAVWGIEAQIRDKAAKRQNS